MSSSISNAVRTGGLLIPAGFFLALAWTTILSRRFNGLYGQDAYGYFDYAQTIAASATRGELPPPYYWPAGFPAMVAIGFLLTGVQPLAGQIVSSLAGAGTVLATGLLTWEAISEWRVPAKRTDLQPPQRPQQFDASPVAPGSHWIPFFTLLSALIASGSGQLWLSGIVVMADTTAVFWAALGGWAMLRAMRRSNGRWLLLAGAALGLAIVTRWLAIVLLIPFVAVALRDRRLSHRWILGMVAATGLVIVPQAAISASFPGPVLGNPWLVGWSPLNAWRHIFDTPDGRAVYDLPVIRYYLETLISPLFLAPLLAPFAVAGFFALVRYRRWLVLTMLLGWIGIILIALAGIPYQNARFLLLLLPPLATLTGIGGASLVFWSIRATRRCLPPIALAGWATLGVASSVLSGCDHVSAFLDRNDRDLGTAHWVERRAGEGARVIAFELSLTLRHETNLRVADLYELTTDERPAAGDRSIAALLAEPEPIWLVARLWRIDQQWAGLAPDRNLRWLRESPGLDLVGERDGYSLFRIRRPEAGVDGR